MFRWPPGAKFGLDSGVKVLYTPITKSLGTQGKWKRHNAVLRKFCNEKNVRHEGGISQNPIRKE